LHGTDARQTVPAVGRVLPSADRYYGELFSKAPLAG
jgi:hypothetical protein